MPNLFHGYCYSTIDEAAVSELALPAMPHSAGVSVAVAYSVISADSVSMTYRYLPYGVGSPSDYTTIRLYPSCSSVGYLTNYSGLSLSDAVEVSFAVVLTWAVAFAFKASRRGL
jgi:hypothetical protein